MTDSGGTAPVRNRADGGSSGRTPIVAERSEQWIEAAGLWALLREQAPALGIAYAGGARALLRLGRMAEAEIVLAKARRDLPPDAGVLEAWADAAIQRAAFEEALARFRSLREAFPSAPRAAVGIAQALHELGRLEEADAVYAELCGTHPVDLSLARRFATIAAERGDWAEAIRRWTQVTAVFSDYCLAIGIGPMRWPRQSAGRKRTPS